MIKSLKTKVRVSFLFFLFGLFLNVFGYESFAPFIVGFIFFGICCFLLLIFKCFGSNELGALMITFSVCWFWSGISAIYANYFNDPSQKLADAAYFYELASGTSSININVFDIGSSLENAAAILIWRIFYDFFESIGFDRDPYIGISVNISLIALTAVIGVTMVKKIFDNDYARIKRFINFFWICPVFWYFASVHVRDAAVLFSISLLSLIWVIYLKKPTKKNLIGVVIATIVSFLLFGLLRTEFIFVPFAMIITAIIAVLIGKASKVAKIVTVFVIFISILAGSLFSSVQTDLMEKIENGNESYNEITDLESGASSLGNQLIVSAPLPIRLVLGSAYLFVFPIPFWVGFQLVSVSNLFRSLQVLYMYAFTPLFILAVKQLIQESKLRSVPILFLLFLSIGFTLAVAYTSLENRHFSAFFLPLLVVSMLPDLKQEHDKFFYFKYFKWFLAIILIIHFAWILIKFL